MDPYQYVHDSENKRVFRFPRRPDVMPQQIAKRKVYHTVRMKVDIVRADNILTGHQWLHPTSDYPSFTYDDRYDEDEAIHYFMRNFAPRGIEITRDEFEALSAQYGKTLK